MNEIHFQFQMAHWNQGITAKRNTLYLLLVYMYLYILIGRKIYYIWNTFLETKIYLSILKYLTKLKLKLEFSILYEEISRAKLIGILFSHISFIIIC